MPLLSTLRRAPFLLWMWYIFVLFCVAIRLPRQIDQVNQEPVKKQYGCSKHRHFCLTGSLDILIFVATFEKQEFQFVLFSFTPRSPVALLRPVIFQNIITLCTKCPAPFRQRSLVSLPWGNVANSAKEIYVLKEHFEKKLIQSFRMNYYLYVQLMLNKCLKDLA